MARPLIWREASDKTLNRDSLRKMILILSYFIVFLDTIQI